MLLTTMQAPLTCRCRRLLARLIVDRSGLALMEFAFTIPLVLGIGMGALELANLSVAHLRIDHTAIDLADNTARMGQQSTSTGYQVLTESNINDAIQALRLEMPKLTTNGRVTISSVEARTDSNGNVTQFLHWQRCAGLKTGSSYETSAVVAAGASAPSGLAAPYDDSGVTIAGIGSPTMTAPSGSALMYVEINYDYPSTFSSIPLVGFLLTGTKKLHYVSAMIVRQTRSTNDSIDNTAGVTKMTCNQHTT
jgi:Flp pilus assembly protein TadG